MRKDELRRLTRAALLEEAKKLEIRGRSTMSKDELVEAIATRGQADAKSTMPKPASRAKPDAGTPAEGRSAVTRGRKPAARPEVREDERPRPERSEPARPRASSPEADRGRRHPQPPPPPRSADADEDEDGQNWNSLALGRDPNYGRFLSPGSIPPRPGAPARRGAPPNGGPRPIGESLSERSERGRMRAVERSYGAREELRRSGDARRQSGYTPRHTRPADARGDRSGRPEDANRSRDSRGEGSRQRPGARAGQDRKGSERSGMGMRRDPRGARFAAPGRGAPPAGLQEDADLGLESREEMILEAPRAPREFTPAASGGRDREAPIPPVAKPTAAAPVASSLPRHYGIDRCRLMVRDPRCVHAYWEIRNETLDRARGDLGDDWEGTKRILRVHGIPISGDVNEPPADFFDLDVTEEATGWYVPVPRPNRGYRVDVGVKTQGGLFYPLASSNTVITPRDGVSLNQTENWASPPASPGAGPTEAAAPQQAEESALPTAPAAETALSERDVRSPVSGGAPETSGALRPDFSGAGRMAEESMREVLFESGRGLIPPGPGIPPGAEAPTSPAGAVPARRREGGFWFVLNTELIVYGATEPDAKVTLQGKPVRLRPDGTFSLRFQLPDGVQELRAEAVSSDGRFQRAITPTVTRTTVSEQSDPENEAAAGSAT